MVQLKRTTIEAKFFVVDQTTTLIGLSDSIKLGLITLNCSDSKKHVWQCNEIRETDETDVPNCESEYFAGKPNEKCQDKTNSDHFKSVILNEYLGTFTRN